MDQFMMLRESHIRRRAIVPSIFQIPRQDFREDGKHTPGAEARSVAGPERPKAEALGYLEATAGAKAKAKAKVTATATATAKAKATATATATAKRQIQGSFTSFRMTTM
jgi:hypothetical protein